MREQLKNDDSISIDVMKDISFAVRNDETWCRVKKGPKIRTMTQNILGMSHQKLAPLTIL